MLDVQNLGVSFGGEVLFESFSFRIGRGDRIGLIGKNGASRIAIIESHTCQCHGIHIGRL